MYAEERNPLTLEVVKDEVKKKGYQRDEKRRNETELPLIKKMEEKRTNQMQHNTAVLNAR